MCGRYYRTADKQAIAEYFHSAAASDEPLPPGYNIAPGTTQPVIRQARDTFVRELVGMRWGLIGFGSSGPERFCPKNWESGARQRVFGKKF